MLQDIISFVVVALISWMGIGSSILYGVNLVRFETPFSQEMVQRQIYDEKTHRSIMRTSWTGCLITFAISVAAVGVFVRQNLLMGLVMTAAGIVVAVIRGRHILGRSNENIRRFVKSHLICMDKDRISQYLLEEFGWTLEQL